MVFPVECRILKTKKNAIVSFNSHLHVDAIFKRAFFQLDEFTTKKVHSQIKYLTIWNLFKTEYEFYNLL